MVDLAVLGLQLGSMILKVFSNLNDSMVVLRSPAGISIFIAFPFL